MGGSGVQRTAKFAKYLPEYGWQPVILTVSNPPLHEADYSLMVELPDDLPVYRAPDMSLPRFLRKAARKFLSRDSQPAAKKGLDTMQAAPPAKGGVRKSWSSFMDTWLQIPDPFVYWLPAALWTGLKIVKECDIIYSTASPFTDHLIAYFLHKLSGKPWIADYRDPWTQYVIFQRSPSKLRARVDAYFEKHLLKTPDVVIVTCAATARSFQELHPSLPKDKFIEITNGFDAEDLDQPVDKCFDRFTIGYTGRFYDKKNASSPFLQALRELREKHPELASKIQIVFAGIFGEQNCMLLKEWGLDEMVKPMGYVSHQESIQLLLKSHVLLLTLSDELGVDLTYPGKLFEYLAARRTILALVPPGATADLIQSLHAGVIVPPCDIEAIYESVLNLYYQYEQGTLLLKTYDNLQKFERRALTERLAQCLDVMLQPGIETYESSIHH
jgi:glycosyltransferase involved in cell wall biosynthesis